MASFTSQREVLSDLLFYAKVRTARPPTLDLVPAITKNRFVFLVENWTNFEPKLINESGGNETIDEAIEEFGKLVDGYNLGDKRNQFDDLDTFGSLVPMLQLIPVQSFTLTKEETNVFQEEIKRVLDFTIDTFREMLKFIEDGVTETSFLIGKGDIDGARVRGVSGGSKLRGPIIQDYDNMVNALNAANLVRGIIYDLQQKEDKPPNLLEIANRNISDISSVSVSDIYRSAVAIPFEISLEHMADKYLGDRRKWFELVTVNNLQPPFVDENGEKLFLEAPAAVNNLTISDSLKASVPVGTKILIGSFKVREEPRIVEKFVDNKNGTITLFLSGAQDLSKLKTEHSAFVRIFKPHTVSSRSFVLIPLTGDSPLPSVKTPSRDEIRRLDKALLAFGVDIARDEITGDLILDSNGNFKLTFGIPNVRQTVRNMLRTRLGELPFHPSSFGITENTGNKYFGTTSEAQILGDVLTAAVLRDQRFTAAVVRDFQLTGNSVSLDILVLIRGSNVPIPLSYVT